MPQSYSFSLKFMLCNSCIRLPEYKTLKHTESMKDETFVDWLQRRKQCYASCNLPRLQLATANNQLFIFFWEKQAIKLQYISSHFSSFLAFCTRSASVLLQN